MIACFDLTPGAALTAMRQGRHNRFFIFDSSSSSNTTIENYSAASESVTSDSGISLAIAGPTSPNSLNLTSAFAPISVGVGDEAIKNIGSQLKQLTSSISAERGVKGNLASMLGLDETTIKWIIFGIVGVVLVKVFMGK